MPNSITIQDAEICVVGLVFVVSYRYYKGAPATYWQPADPAVVELLAVAVKGQPEVDVYELLAAIKVHPKIIRGDVIDFTTGDELIEQYILENPPL